MNTNQMDATLIANNPEFHATWEGIQRKLGAVLSAAHNKTTTREQFELVIDAVIYDLRYLRGLKAAPLPLAQATAKITVTAEDPGPDRAHLQWARQLEADIVLLGLTTREQVERLCAIRFAGPQYIHGRGGCHVWVKMNQGITNENWQRLLVITGTGPDWE